MSSLYILYPVQLAYHCDDREFLFIVIATGNKMLFKVVLAIFLGWKRCKGPSVELYTSYIRYLIQLVYHCDRGFIFIAFVTWTNVLFKTVNQFPGVEKGNGHAYSQISL